MIAIWRTYSRFKVKSQRQLPGSLRRNSRHVRKTPSNIPRRATSLPSSSTLRPKYSGHQERENEPTGAVDLLNQAVARDPSFFKAYCQLAHTHDRLYFLGYDHTPARLALAEAAIQAAFRLGPDAGEAHLARAQNLYRGYLEYDAALAELEVAGQTLPNDAGVFELKAYIQRRRGKQEEAVRSLERAIDIDPRNTFTLQQIALSYHHLRRFAEEKSVLDRALAIEPNDVDTKVARAFVEFHWKADTRRCIKYSIQFGPQIPPPRRVSPTVG